MLQALSRAFKGALGRLAVYLALAVFYMYGFLWTLRPRRVRTAGEVLEVFYYGFLRLRSEDIEVVRVSDGELVTISRNPCPILKLALTLGMDTRYVCRVVSETVCRYVLRRLNPRLVFERDYSYIRPYSNGCLEKVYWGPHNFAGLGNLRPPGSEFTQQSST